MAKAKKDSAPKPESAKADFVIFVCRSSRSARDAGTRLRRSIIATGLTHWESSGVGRRAGLWASFLPDVDRPTEAVVAWQRGASEADKPGGLAGPAL